MGIPVLRSAFALASLFEERKSEDIKFSDELSTYLKLHYKFLTVSDGDVCHVGELYYETKMGNFYVVTHHINKYIQMVQLTYDQFGNLTSNSGRVGMNANSLNESHYEYIGTYNEYFNDEDFRSMIHLKYMKGLLEQGLSETEEKLNNVTEKLSSNPYFERFNTNKEECNENQ